MIAIVEFEKNISSTCILGIIVCKLCHWKEFSPIILFPIHKRSKICFYCIILLFALAIRLEIKGGGKLLLDIKEVTE